MKYIWFLILSINLFAQSQILLFNDDLSVIQNGLVYDFSASNVTLATSPNVSTILNKGTLTVNGVQNTGGNQADLVSGELKGNPVLRFDADDNYTIGLPANWTFIHDGTGMTIFIIVKKLGSSNEYFFYNTTSASATGFRFLFATTSFLFNIGNGTSAIYSINGAMSNAWHIICISYKNQSGTDLKYKVDGGAITKTNQGGDPNTNASGDNTILGRSTIGLNSDFGRMVIYNRELTDDEINQNFKILNTKYGIY